MFCGSCLICFSYAYKHQRLEVLLFFFNNVFSSQFASFLTMVQDDFISRCWLMKKKYITIMIIDCRWHRFAFSKTGTLLLPFFCQHLITADQIVKCFSLHCGDLRQRIRLICFTRKTNESKCSASRGNMI